METVVELSGIRKSFGGVRALQGVDFALRRGEVHALLGENGAGKSTLMRVLGGEYTPEAGTVKVGGSEQQFRGPMDALEKGIAIIHQEMALAADLTVAENIFLGHAPKTRFRTIDWKAMNERSKELLISLESNIDPTIRLKDLSIAQRHLVAIARALSIEARIVIMDEPTAALSRKEIDDLFRIVQGLKAKGKAILFISHKFDELYEIADNFAVFRDGKAVGAGRLKETPQDTIVKMMVGRDVENAFPKIDVAIGAPVMSVEKYCHRTEFRDISFTLRKGEILGVYGLIGAGRSELSQSLFGITKPLSGRLTLEGKELSINSPLDAIRAGIVYVPEERGRHGLALPMPIYQNMTLPSLTRTSRKGFLKAAEEFALARKYAERLDLRAAALSVPVGTLSGGNQQKVVIGKWLATMPKVIILDEPTKGIDIGSKAAVHGFISELAAEGLSIIMISSELPEIIGMSDRVLVMKEGLSAGLYDRDKLSPEVLVRAATGNA